MKKLCIVACLCVLFLSSVSQVGAASLTRTSDLITNSIPGATTTQHTLTFTVTTAIPASGSILITPEDGAFTIPSGFDVGDVDFAVSTGGPSVDRDLSASPTSLLDGVSVTTGTSGSITIELNSSLGVVAGSEITLELGTHATHGATGDSSITNPSSAGSYRIRIETRDSGNTRIDDASAMVAMVTPIAGGAEINESPPIISDGLPSGMLAAGNSSIEISFRTNEVSTCRYATSSGVVYGSMTNTFNSSGGTLFYKVISGHVDETSYAYYIRCIDLGFEENTDDYVISFSLDETPETDVSDGVAPGDGNGGVGTFSQGSRALYLASVILSGWFAPGSTITVLKDGKSTGTVQANNAGNFQKTITDLERGTYTFVIYAQDRKSKKTASFISTLSVVQGTTNKISDILLSPTIALDNDTVGVGESVRVSGESVPGSEIEVLVKRQTDLGELGNLQKFFASSTKSVPNVQDGTWELVIPPGILTKGTYVVQARAIQANGTESGLGLPAYLGVGEAPSPDFSTGSDLNGDGKVNLVDFSILLSFWGESAGSADINSDGTINLADVSILLFNWTG